MLKYKKFLIGGIIIFIALGYLAFTGFKGSTTYYYTVGEVINKGSSIYNENIRVNGKVAPGSVLVETNNLIVKFNIVESDISLPIIYKGAVPDTFKEGSDIVLEGYLNPTGVFQAKTIITKCPSKYVPQKK